MIHTARGAKDRLQPNLLCVVPPYGTRPPAGTAYLLGHLQAEGCHDFDFVDLRLGAPFDFTPTYRTTGTFGESYVIDVPDLPLILGLLEAVRTGGPLAAERSPLFDRYCLERGISPQYLERYIQSMDRYLRLSFDQIPDIRFIGFSVWSTNLFFTLMAAAHLKRRRRPPMIIAGGPQVTSSAASADLALRAGLLDVVALGDGEETLLEVYRSFQQAGDVPRGVPGTATLEASSGKVQRVERKLKRMKEIACPSFDKIPIHAYQVEGRLRALPLQFSRGCTDRCTFCSEWVFWQRFRPDLAENVVAYIRALKERYRCEFIDFSDSLLNGVPNRLTALAEILIAERTDIGWTAFMRAKMDPQTARLIARAGCSGVFIGVESFSDETLALMNKRRTEADNIEAIRSFLQAGIHVTAGFIPGFPGDSRHGFLHSVTVARQLQDEYPGMLELHEEPFTVMASAPIYHQLDTYGLRPVAWDREYLDIAAGYGDITSKIVCHVEGDGQGLERMGRMNMVGAIKSDAPVSGSFEDGEDDDLTVDHFAFDHLRGKWHCARIKTANGYRYALLVDDREKAKLEAFQEAHFPIHDISDRKLGRVLSPMERRHILPPPRKIQAINRGMYVSETPPDCRYAVSPFVIARPTGTQRSSRVLFLNTLNQLVMFRSPLDAQIVAAIGSSRGIGCNALWRRLRGTHPDLSIDTLQGKLDELKESGILTIFSRQIAQPAARKIVAPTEARPEPALRAPEGAQP
jgi:radical SAM superfamily enzyme YgiQ (UPF0313 family)